MCSVFTWEEHRGKGYQKDTFKACLEYAKNLGIVRFELGTVNPHAIKMYKKFGFVFNQNAMKLKL